MFTDFTTEVIGFPSISRKPREISSNESQTPAIELKHEEIQLKSSESKEIQTDTPTYGIGSYDEEALLSFLKRMTPSVLEELDVVVDLTDLDDDERDSESTAVKIQSLTALSGMEKKISCLSWSSTGGTLAVTTSALRHDSWCSHEGQLALFTTSVTSSAPPRIISTSSCATSVSFHPWQPSVLAVGLYNGEVLIRDLRREDDWAAKEEPLEHVSSVTYVGWCGTVNEAQCISAGADGRIILRKFGLQSRNLSVIAKFLITKSHLNQKYDDKSDGVEITAAASVEGDGCIVGVAGGGVYLTKLTPLQPLATHPGYHDPVVTTYQPHRSIVTSICPAAQKNIFASVSCDGEIRVYSMIEVEPKHIIHLKGCLLDAFWANQPTLLGICGPQNHVKFVKVTTGQIHGPIVELSGRNEATVAKLNSRSNVVAVGDSYGKIELWRVTLAKKSG